MCGIVGVVSAYKNGFDKTEQDIFKDMLFLDTLRGWDSTGGFVVSNKGNVRIRKAAIHGPDFIQSDGYKDLKNHAWTDGQFMVGHNRAATRGTVKDENAHPFWVDDKIILVQNGTYNGSHKHHKDVEVDTEAVAHVLADTPDISEALQKINAAYALVWYNVDDKTLYLIRNEQRPLCVAKTADGSVLFASEAATIFYSAFRNGVKLAGNPRELNPGELMSFKLTDKGYEEGTQEIAYKFSYTKHGYTAAEDAEFFSMEEYWRQRQAVYGGQKTHATPPTRALAHHALDNSRENMYPQERSIYHYINDGVFEDWAVTPEQATEIIKEYNPRMGGVVPVEFTEYFAVHPYRKDCKEWYVAGKILGEEVSPIIYLRALSMTEEQIVEFTSHSLYNVVIHQGPVTNHVPASIAKKSNPYRLVTLFCHRPVPIEVLQPVKATENVH